MRLLLLAKCLLAGLIGGIVFSMLWFVDQIVIVPMFTSVRDVRDAAGGKGPGGGLQIVEAWGSLADLVLPFLVGLAIGFAVMFRRQRPNFK